MTKFESVEETKARLFANSFMEQILLKKVTLLKTQKHPVSKEYRSNSERIVLSINNRIIEVCWYPSFSKDDLFFVGEKKMTTLRFFRFLYSHFTKPQKTELPFPSAEANSYVKSSLRALFRTKKNDFLDQTVNDVFNSFLDPHSIKQTSKNDTALSFEIYSPKFKPKDPLTIHYNLQYDEFNVDNKFHILIQRQIILFETTKLQSDECLLMDIADSGCSKYIEDHLEIYVATYYTRSDEYKLKKTFDPDFLPYLKALALPL